MKRAVHYKAGPFLPVTENWIYNQITNLVSYESIVYCHGTANTDVYPFERIRDFGAGRVSDPYGFANRVANESFGINPFVRHALKGDRPDIVHAHYGQSGYFMSRTRGSGRFGLVTTFYGDDLSRLPAQKPWWRRRYGRLFAGGDLFLLEGPHMRQSLIELGCPAEKARVHHLGIDLEAVRSEPRVPGADGAVKVLISGSFREKKGIPYAIEAIGLARRQRPDLELSVTIVGDSGGSPAEEAEKARVLAAIEEYGLEGRVEMAGFRPHDYFLRALYDHHIFLSPSVTATSGDTEGGAPVSIIEASASGMPVLSTTHCDIPGVVLDGVTGYLVAERDSRALSEKLVALAGDPASWIAMGQSARRHIESEFDARKQGKALARVYDEVVSARSPGQ
ncbi:MAG: glycosyltransferase [Candidatus Geothermincolia bacterium]